MILIFAVDGNWKIGVDGQMLVEIEEDLHRFKEITDGHIVVMGRKTMEALPGQNPLPNRINIIITRQEDFKKEGFLVVNSMEDLFPLLKQINPDKEKKVFVTGGGTIARQLLLFCNKAYITKVFKDFKNTDTFIPNLDLDDAWEVASESEVQRQDDIYYRYVDYERVKW
ncbi:MAG: dihydrofolate reductase [Gudongella sp.]|jgi:dihydrofolate reductase|nr:dihydrofolate reductase [Gudongella sp.]